MTALAPAGICSATFALARLLSRSLPVAVWRGRSAGHTSALEKESGWAVGWLTLKSGSRISRADQRQREKTLRGSPGRHTGGRALLYR